MSPQRFVADVRAAVEKFGLTKIINDDDQALLRKDRTKVILAGLAELGLLLEFHSGLNVKFMDTELARLFKAAGLEIANLAIESGSERVLKEIIVTPMKAKDVHPAVKMLMENSLLVHCFFIFGFLGETEENCQATVVANNYPDHAFTRDPLARAYALKGSNQQKVLEHRQGFETIIKTDADWAARAREFELP